MAGREEGPEEFMEKLTASDAGVLHSGDFLFTWYGDVFMTLN